MIDTDKVVMLHEIAAIAGVTPAAVSNWRQRDYLAFPAPVAIIGDKPMPRTGRPSAVELFDLDAILRWLEATNRTTPRPKSTLLRGH